jgi:hypothetical protein
MPFKLHAAIVATNDGERALQPPSNQRRNCSNSLISRHQHYRQDAFFVVETAHVVQPCIRLAILFVPLLSAEAGLCVVKLDAIKDPNSR